MAPLIPQKQERERLSNFQCLCWKNGVNLDHICQGLKIRRFSAVSLNHMTMQGKGQEERTWQEHWHTTSQFSVTAQLITDQFVICYLCVHASTEGKPAFIFGVGLSVLATSATSKEWVNFTPKKMHFERFEVNETDSLMEVFLRGWKGENTLSTFSDARREGGMYSVWCLGIEPNPWWRTEGREP